MVNWAFKKISTYVIENAALVSEFWIIGLLHEIGRHSVYYNGNVNTPKIGYYVTCLFAMFYLSKVIGMIFGLAFADKRKHVLVTYLFAIPLVIATYFQGVKTGALWMVIFRCIIGFCTGFEPVLGLLRGETDKMELTERFNKFKAGQLSEKRYKAITNVAPILTNTLEFTCSYGVIVLASLLYNFEAQNIKRPSIVFAIITFVLIIVFFAGYKCYEAQEVDHLPHIQDFQRRKQKVNRMREKAPGFLKVFFEDEDLMLDTAGVKLYEAVRMVDLVFMIIMIQTNPYYKGLWMDRTKTMITVCIAALIALFIGLFLRSIISYKNASGWMQMVSIVSIFLYPISATIINYISYSNQYTILFTFGFFELVKFTFLYIMREGLREMIKKEAGGGEESKKGDENKFKAMGHIIESIWKFLVFAVFGWLITMFMNSERIQKMNPYNYLISFLVLCLPLIASWFMLTIAAAMEDDKK